MRKSQRLYSRMCLHLAWCAGLKPTSTGMYTSGCRRQKSSWPATNGACMFRNDPFNIPRKKKNLTAAEWLTESPQETPMNTTRFFPSQAWYTCSHWSNAFIYLKMISPKVTKLWPSSAWARPVWHHPQEFLGRTEVLWGNRDINRGCAKQNVFTDICYCKWCTWDWYKYPACFSFLIISIFSQILGGRGHCFTYLSPPAMMYEYTDLWLMSFSLLLKHDYQQHRSLISSFITFQVNWQSNSCLVRLLEVMVLFALLLLVFTATRKAIRPDVPHPLSTTRLSGTSCTQTKRNVKTSGPPDQ